MMLQEDHIIQFVCYRYGVTVDDLRGPSTEQSVSWPRHVCAWLMRRLMQASTYRSIGEALGRRPMATRYAVQCVTDRMFTDALRHREVTDLLTALTDLRSGRPVLDLVQLPENPTSLP